MRANLQLIKERLFDCAGEKIARDYQLDVPATAEELSQQLLQLIDQQAWENPLNQKYDNSVIFRAVVRTLGSNSRKWTTCLTNELQIRQILCGFRVEEVDRNPPNCFELARLLSGQTATADACAILNWAHRLSETQNYYASVVQASSEIQRRVSKEHQDPYMPSHKLFLSVVAHFTDASFRSRSRKWPGMGFVLGSEFLRNLHWNGFKPDRHIKRLLQRWTKDQINVDQTMEQLQCIIGRRDGALSENLRWSLIGMEITPEDHRANFSQFDNLIWLLGAYVEKKGRESEYNYMLTEPADHLS
jgi:hypothetical protein